MATPQASTPTKKQNNNAFDIGANMDLSQQILSDIVVFQKYARHIDELHRRESWQELCDRNMAMHIRKYPQLKDRIKQVYADFVVPRKVLPSMRSMQFGGAPIELSNNRIFNCAFSAVDHPAVFAETMFNLLSGSGCFKSDTLVKTDSGDKQFCDLTTDDKILTYDENLKEFFWVNPSWVGTTESAILPKVKLTCEDGTEIMVTGDHKFLTQNRGWVEAIKLTPDDEIVSS